MRARQTLKTAQQAVVRASRAAITVGHGAFRRYDRDHGELLAAGLAFYGLLSLAPLSLLAVMLVGLIIERERARAVLLDTISRLATSELSAQTALVLERMRSAASEVAAVVSLLTLLWAASRLFVQVQTALNAVWGVRVRESRTTREAIRRMVIKRLVSFAMVAACGLLLMVLVVLNTVLSALTRNLAVVIPLSGWSAGVLMIQHYLLSVAILSVLFAVVYRVLPDARIPWRDVWVGALLTAGLVLAGTVGFGLVLGRMSAGWVNGALGSIAAFVFWIYYQAQVFMLGAAVTREYTARREGRIQPEDHAQLSEPP